ncbi:MAG: hypothetical protein IAF58_06555, partial [Leptolyngbya sp.]|nr:hypothetical protein [Candidatus Melainabacteria bacterium]
QKTDAALVLFLKTAPDELRPSIASYLNSRDVESVKLSKAPAPQTLYQQAEELRQQGKLKEAVAIYIAILQSKETNPYVIRDAALKALRNGNAGTKTNILNSRLAWLAKDAASGNYLEVTDTAEILRRLNSPKCIDALLQVLHRRDSLFQNAHRTATFALRELGPEVQKRAAASILDDIKNNADLSNNFDQQIETLVSFAWIKSKDSFQESQKLVEADKNWTSSWNKVIPLMESLSHEDEGLELSKLLRDGKDLSPKVIEWTIFRLGDLRESNDVETLLRLYSDKPYYYQPTLKEALVKIGGAKIITYMRQSAITKHPQQATAVEILAEIEKKKVLPIMHQVAHSGNLDARIRSIAAIGQYGNCDDRKALLPGADYWKGDRDVHYWLIQALNAIEHRCHCQ